jgi:hypothetical protein
VIGILRSLKKQVMSLRNKNSPCACAESRKFANLDHGPGRLDWIKESTMQDGCSRKKMTVCNFGTDWKRLCKYGTDWKRLSKSGTDWKRLSKYGTERKKTLCLVLGGRKWLSKFGTDRKKMIMQSFYNEGKWLCKPGTEWKKMAMQIWYW